MEQRLFPPFPDPNLDPQPHCQADLLSQTIRVYFWGLEIHPLIIRVGSMRFVEPRFPHTLTASLLTGMYHQNPTHTILESGLG